MTEEAMKMIMKAIVSISAIAGLVIIECKAMEIGMDGFILSIVIASISGLAGFNLRDVLRKME